MRLHGVDVPDDEERVLRVATGLLDRQREAEKKRRQDIAEWGRFQEALGGLLVEDWRADANRARDAAERTRLRAEELAADLGEEQLRLASLETEYQKMEHRLKEAREEASRTAGQLEQIDATSVDVASAEAQVQESETELDRVRRLQETLETTKEHLQAAADRAHRLLAPQLRELMTEWIPVITQERYVDALVDPETLEVTLQTADGGRHEAVLLSHGTAEQVYLLLRMILAQVLTNKHERCPVLLDDPTVHADAGPDCGAESMWSAGYPGLGVVGCGW